MDFELQPNQNEDYKNGKRAFMQSKGLSDNPHGEGSDEHTQWANGFKDAYRIMYQDGKTTDDNYIEIKPRLIDDLDTL